MELDARAREHLRTLKRIDFELAYLALLTVEGLKPLSRWEKPLGEESLDALQPREVRPRPDAAPPDRLLAGEGQTPAGLTRGHEPPEGPLVLRPLALFPQLPPARQAPPHAPAPPARPLIPKQPLNHRPIVRL